MQEGATLLSKFLNIVWGKIMTLAKTFYIPVLVIIQHSTTAGINPIIHSDQFQTLFTPKIKILIMIKRVMEMKKILINSIRTI